MKEILEIDGSAVFEPGDIGAGIAVGGALQRDRRRPSTARHGHHIVRSPQESRRFRTYTAYNNNNKKKIENSWVMMTD